MIVLKGQYSGLYQPFEKEYDTMALKDLSR